MREWGGAGAAEYVPVRGDGNAAFGAQGAFGDARTARKAFHRKQDIHKKCGRIHGMMVGNGVKKILKILLTPM